MKLSLNLFRRPRLALIALKRAWYVHVYGMDLHPTCTFSLKAKFDRTHPRGVHVGRESYVALDAIIFAHDMTRGLRADTFIGERCFIGARSIVMAGVRIGDQCIVAAGSVVVRDVPPNSIAAGNPAKVVRDGIRTTRGGCLEGAGYLAHDPAGWLTEFRDQ